MEAPKKKLNPIIAAGAVALVIVAGLAAAAFTGMLPGTQDVKEPEAQAPQARAQQPASKPRLASRLNPFKCADCGTVLGVLQITEKGEGTGLGAVAGGVGGAVIGNQIGDDSQERMLGRVVGAVGGALAGHEIERQAKRTKRWDVNIQMEDGSQRMISYSEQPAFKAGDKVRLVDGQLVGRAG